MKSQCRKTWVTARYLLPESFGKSFFSEVWASTTLQTTTTKQLDSKSKVSESHPPS